MISRNEWGQVIRRAHDQIRHPDFGHIIGRVVCGACGNRELLQVRRYADHSVHLLTPDLATGKLLGGRRGPGGARRPVPWLDLCLDDIRGDSTVACPKHGSRPLTTGLLRRLATGRATRPDTVRV